MDIGQRDKQISKEKKMADGDRQRQAEIQSPPICKPEIRNIRCFVLFGLMRGNSTAYRIEKGDYGISKSAKFSNLFRRR